jgi:hypothetical protein
LLLRGVVRTALAALALRRAGAGSGRDPGRRSVRLGRRNGAHAGAGPVRSAPACTRRSGRPGRGIRVAAQQLRLRSEQVDGTVRDGFSSLVETSTEGRIVEERVHLQDEPRKRRPPCTRPVSSRLVALEDGTRDPGFTLDLVTSRGRARFVTEKPLVLEITASRRCYLNLDPDRRGRRVGGACSEPSHGQDRDRGREDDSDPRDVRRDSRFARGCPRAASESASVFSPRPRSSRDLHGRRGRRRRTFYGRSGREEPHRAQPLAAAHSCFAARRGPLGLRDQR